MVATARQPEGRRPRFRAMSSQGVGQSISGPVASSVPASPRTGSLRLGAAVDSNRMWDEDGDVADDRHTVAVVMPLPGAPWFPAPGCEQVAGGGATPVGGSTPIPPAVMHGLKDAFVNRFVTGGKEMPGRSNLNSAGATGIEPPVQFR